MGTRTGDYRSVTPSDSTYLEGFEFLRADGAGTLILQGSRGDQVTLTVAAKEYVPFSSGKVMAASTATGIVAIG